MLYSLLRHKAKFLIPFCSKFKIIQTVERLRPELIKKMATSVNLDFANFEAKLSLSNPSGDYAKLIEDKMRADVIMPQEVYTACWSKISTAAMETIWKLLFDEENAANADKFEKAAELLKTLKEDSCFYRAAEYNSWIVLVRDELLKRNMIDFWKNVIVKLELGPCWARDSDLFDDVNDPNPANFYKHADCEAPWLKQTAETAETAAQNAEDVAAPFLVRKASKENKALLKEISEETPLADYVYNMNKQSEILDDDDAYIEIFQEARDMLWKLLFSEPILTDENARKAAALLEEYKRDACFYSPWEYNEWIRKVKDEVEERKYIDFWNNYVVAKELGLCCARDSDFFDNTDDPEPSEFYKLSNK